MISFTFYKSKLSSTIKQLKANLQVLFLLRNEDFIGKKTFLLLLLQVSYPQYIRLMKLQEKALKLDTIMRKLAEGRNPAQLSENAKWNELLALRQSLQKLLPADHPEFELTSNQSKRGATMDFNGIQVQLWYPQKP